MTGSGLEAYKINGKEHFTMTVEQIIASISRLSNAGVCIYDLKNFFSYDDKDAIKHQFKGHYCNFCYMVRNLPGGKQACIASDVEDAVKLAEAYRKPFFHQCHIGILEYVVPLIYKDQMIAIVFIGQCRVEGEVRFENVMMKIEAFGGSADTFKKYYNDLPVIDRSILLSAGAMLDVAFKYLMEKKGKNALDQYFVSKNLNYVSRAVVFIETYFAENITSGDVIAHVHLNNSYFARLFKNETGKSITDYIIGIRVERAKDLLTRTKIPVGNIALNVGFSDQNYFTRKFVQVVGCSPSSFRKGARQE